MRERLVYVVTPAQTEVRQSPQEPTLAESLEGKELPLRVRQARNLIDKMEIPLEQKRLLFFYHLWHQTGSYGPIKEFGDIREDATIFSIRDKVLENDELVSRYEEFYTEFALLTDREVAGGDKSGDERKALPKSEKSRKTKKRKKPVRLRREIMSLENPLYKNIADFKKRGFTHAEIAKELNLEKTEVDRISGLLIRAEVILPSPKGRGQRRLFEERAAQILPLRNILTISEISERTGFSQDYIKSIFKRLVRVGKIERISKIKKAEEDPNYEVYRIIREGVMELRNSTEYRYSEQEIAEILTQELGQEITVQQVKRQLRLLLRGGKIKRRINQVK